MSELVHVQAMTPTFGWTPQALVNDSRISLRAKGLFLWLNSRPPGWEVNISDLVSQHREGRAALRTSIVELTKTGWLMIERMKDDAGRFVGSRWTILPQPENRVVDSTRVVEPSSPQPGFRILGNPAPGNRDPETGIHSKDRESKQKKKKNLAHRGPLPPPSKINGTYPQPFEEAWAAYPKREGSNPKKAGYGAWRARLKSGVPADSILEATKRYADHCIEQYAEEDRKFVQRASTFWGPSDAWEEWTPSAEEPVSDNWQERLGKLMGPEASK